MQPAAEMSMKRARLTGVVCLLYLGSIEVLMIAVGRNNAIYNAGGIMANVFYLIFALLLYRMFQPVDRWLALAASACGVLGCITNLLPYATHGKVHITAIPFLASFIILTGILIIRSRFLPQILGWLQVISGLGWLLTRLPWGHRVVGPHIGDLDFIVQLALGLWLVIKGVNLTRWNTRANATA